MHFKPVRAAARTAAVGGVAALGLGALQAAALAGPSVVHVPCNVTTLNTVITDATSGETIVLAPGCVYDLPAALPDIAVQLTIVGRHSVLQRSSAGATPDFTILTVATGGNLTVDKVNFYNGGGSTVDYGGAIYNDGGVLAVHGGTYGGNSDLDYGGAIYNDGGMQITGATFTNNSSDYGGAIYNDDQADITSTTFDHNRGTDGYAGAFYNDRNAVITHCDFISNTTEDYGGGIYNGKTLAVNDSQFQHNGAEYGGGIYNDDGVVVADSEFALNESYEGGGLYDYYYATVRHSAFVHNFGDYGAGLYDDDAMSVSHSRVNYNAAFAQGGGIYNDDATLNVGDTTIFSNSATSGGGGIYNYSGGIVSLSHATIYNNKPDNCEPLGTITGCTS